MKTFSIIIVTSLVMTLSVTAFAQKNNLKEQTPKHSVQEKTPSPWQDNTDYWRIEYQLRYLMDANIEAHLLEKKENDVDRLLDHLSEGLTSLYGSAVECMKKSPNPRLAKILLAHHKAYLDGSASEELAENIESLQKLIKKNKRK